MPTAGTTHSITLAIGDSVVGFMLVPGTFQGPTRVSDFAPRISTGTDPTTREGYWESWHQQSAQEGIDKLSFENDGRIYSSDGNVYTLRPQGITLDTAYGTADAGVVATAPQIIDSGTNYIVVGIGTTPRRYSISGGTWAAASAGVAASVVWLHRKGSRLFAALGSGNDFEVSDDDGDNWANPGGSAVGIRADGFFTYKNELYRWLANKIRKAANGTGGTWTGTVDIEVGGAESNITNVVVAWGNAFIRKEDGLYYFDGTEVHEVFRRPNTLYSGNKGLCFHTDSFLYYNELGRVRKLSFSGGNINESDITPEMWGNEDKELYGHGIPVWLWSGLGSQLYAAFDDGQGVYPEVLRHNGLGWHQYYLGTSGDTMRAAGYSRLAGFTLWNDGATRHRRHTTLRDTPYPSYATSGVMQTADFQVLPFSNKAFRDVTVEAENLSAAAGRKISVSYSLDKGTTLVALGDVLVDGKTRLTFDPTDSTVVSEQARLQITLTRGSDAAKTPILRRWATSLLNRPDSVYGFRMQLKLGGYVNADNPGQSLLDNTSETLTTDALLAHLIACDNSDEPVLLTDPYGTETYVFFTRFTTTQPSQDEESDERLVDLEMVEALAVARWDVAYYEAAYYA